jgi:anthranilate phosphoribosyltransferase
MEREMANDPQAFLERLLDGEHLSEGEAGGLMRALTDQTLPPAVAGALLAALRAKGETAEEVRGFARTMHALAHEVHLPRGLAAADSAGTGGDLSGSLNLSSGVALLAAACGVPMVKHGNRSVSSRSGSADVLQALGVPLAPDANTALDCLKHCGFTFLFAPFFHPAMKAVAPVRAAMGVRTVFNFLGPLANPAAPPYYLLGAFDMPHARLLADSLSGLKLERAFVVHGEPGWDEATPCGPFALFDVRPGAVREERRDPLDVGLPRCSPDALAGGDAAHNAAALEAVLRGDDQGPHRDALLLGAGLLLEVTARQPSLGDGIAAARDTLESGGGAVVLDRLRDYARSL